MHAIFYLTATVISGYYSIGMLKNRIGYVMVDMI